MNDAGLLAPLADIAVADGAYTHGSLTVPGLQSQTVVAALEGLEVDVVGVELVVELPAVVDGEDAGFAEQAAAPKASSTTRATGIVDREARNKPFDRDRQVTCITTVCPSVPSDARPPYRFGDLLALARRSWVRQLRARVDQAGYPDYRPTDAWVLRLLTERPLAIGQAGQVMGITRQAARQLADGLVQRGFAALESDPEDGRRTLVVLTAAGGAYARVVARAQDELNEAMLGRVSPRDIAVADSVLRAVFPTVERRTRIDERIPPPRADE